MNNKLLLVDDNVDMLLIGKRIFGRAGYDFYTSRNGQEGLETAKFHKPDIIILDYILPDINGKEFIKTIANQPEYESLRNIPIVVLTAKAEEIDNLQECYHMGMRAFLNKPFGHRELVNVVDNIVRTSKLERVAKSQPQNGKPKPEATIPVPRHDDPDPDWMDDLVLANSTIASLCRQLYNSELANLTEQQKLDVYAIYNSSKRMSRLINKKGEAQGSYLDR